VSGDQYFYLISGVGPADDPAQAVARKVMLSGTGVEDPIAVKFEQMGGAGYRNPNPLGQAVSNQYKVAGGKAQDFVNGAIYWSSGTGAHAVLGSIWQKYREMGGPAGALGFPVTDELPAADGVGRYNHFSRAASVYWSPSTRAHAVVGAIRVKWAQLGWEKGLGYPRTDEYSVTGGRRQDFQRGRLTWNSRTGAVTRS
jgi:uncharacterized protein with LGFP repeats